MIGSRELRVSWGQSEIGILKKSVWDGAEGSPGTFCEKTQLEPSLRCGTHPPVKVRDRDPFE